MNDHHTHAVAGSLLSAHDPSPVWTVGEPASPSPFLLICDHAGNRIPASLDDLGIDANERSRHIAWDIGVESLGRALAQRLGAHCIGQRYSRLVIDCNREPGSQGSIAEVSDGTVIPGNQALSDQQKAARRAEVFEPYHRHIAAELRERRQRGQSTALILLHSFTPVMAGRARPWQAGVLYDRDARLALSLREELAACSGWLVGDNEPYAGTDGTDYALRHYGEALSLPYVELEIRQDLLIDEDGPQRCAAVLAIALPLAFARVA